MKRYPKRVQHRWGPRRKFTGAPRRWTGLTLNFGPGTYVEGDVYTFTSMCAGTTESATIIIRADFGEGGPMPEIGRIVEEVGEVGKRAVAEWLRADEGQP